LQLLPLGYITSVDEIPDEPMLFTPQHELEKQERIAKSDTHQEKPKVVEGRVWYIPMDNVDTDMIFHNRYLAITDINEMGQYTFDNLEGYEDFAKKAKKGDIVILQKNFGSGSSRQQAVDCFKSLGIQAIVAESYGAIYERNAINAAFPIVRYNDITALEVKDGNIVRVNFETGLITNVDNGKSIQGEPFSEQRI